MLVYLDTSVLIRAYLADEPDHRRSRRLLSDVGASLVTSSWTRVEGAAAVVRAAAAGRCDREHTLDLLRRDLGLRGRVTLLTVELREIEEEALAIVRRYGLRSLDALHLAVALIAAVPLLEAGEKLRFASRDKDQLRAARGLGFVKA